MRCGALICSLHCVISCDSANSAISAAILFFHVLKEPPVVIFHFPCAAYAAFPMAGDATALDTGQPLPLLMGITPELKVLLELQCQNFSLLLDQAVQPMHASLNYLITRVQKLEEKLLGMHESTENAGIMDTSTNPAFDSAFPVFAANNCSDFAAVWKTVGKGKRNIFAPAPKSIAQANRFAALDAQREVDLMKEKAQNLVICRLPEGADDAATVTSDRSLIDRVFCEAQLDPSHIKKVERFPPGSKALPGRMRILKVYTNSEDTRNAALTAFHRRPRQPEFKSSTFARRDYTETEQEKDSLCKNQVHLANVKVGVRQFIVRDLRIIEAPKPWDVYHLATTATDNRSRRAKRKSVATALDPGENDADVSIDPITKQPRQASHSQSKSND